MIPINFPRKRLDIGQDIHKNVVLVEDSDVQKINEESNLQRDKKEGLHWVHHQWMVWH